MGITKTVLFFAAAALFSVPTAFALSGVQPDLGEVAQSTGRSEQAGLISDALQRTISGIEDLASTPTAEQEKARLSKLNQAPDFKHAMDFMTPEEIAEDLELQPENQKASVDEPTASDEAFFEKASAGGAWLSIDVNKGTQHIVMTSSEGDSASGPVSTARKGYVTPSGCYHPTSLQRMHYSRKYHMSPMPYSVFFRGGYALHETYETRHLGRPASHGCVRLNHSTAEKIFTAVDYYRSNYGAESVRICIR